MCIFMTTVFAQSEFVKLKHDGVHSEGEFFLKDKKLHSKSLVIKFKEEVVGIDKKSNLASLDNINMKYSGLFKIFKTLDNKYQLETIIRQIKDYHLYDEHIKKYPNTVDLSQLFTIVFQQPVYLDSVIRVLENVEVVEYVHEPVSIIYLNEPDDPEYQNGNQWYLDIIEAEDAWNISKGDPDIVIGIVDSGIKTDHEDLNDKIVGGNNIVEKHGTRVAGIAAAETDNNTGIASLGWNTSLYTLGASGILSKANAIATASQNSKIINLSWGTVKTITSSFEYSEICPTCPPIQINKWLNKVVVPHSYPEIATAIQNAIYTGDICIAAAGNKSLNIGPSSDCNPMLIPFAQYPASYTDVIAVSGTELVSGIERFNNDWNYGNHVDFAAPGKDILSPDLNGYSTDSGTSFSAPLVSALISLILDLNQNLTVSQIHNILKHSADEIGQYSYNSNGWNQYMGYGRINAYEALDYTLKNYCNVSGTISSNSTWSGCKYIESDIIINTGVTLSIEAGTTIFFKDSKKLVVNGTLQANGTAQNKIDFKPLDNYWNGIEFTNTTGNNRLNYCTISQSSIWGVKVYNSNLDIDNSVISNCSLHGVFLSGNSNVWTYGSEIVDNDQFGVVIGENSYYEAEMTLIDNNGDYSGQGLETGGIFCEGECTLGSSQISYNDRWGFWAESGSWIDLDESNLGGNNTIFNDEFEIISDISIDIPAEMNYWGYSNGPLTSKLDGNIDYDPYLSDEPVDNPWGLNKTVSSNSIQDLIIYRNSLKLLREEKYLESMNEFENLIKEYPKSYYIKFAIAKIISIINYENTDNVIQYLENISNEKSLSGIKNDIKKFLFHIYRKNGDNRKVNELLKYTKQDQKYDKFVNYYKGFYFLEDLNDTTKAVESFEKYILKYPDDYKSQIIVHELKNLGKDVKITDYINIIEASTKTCEFFPSHPNPFNPSTTISFNLLKPTVVDLRIYNLKGQEVWKLKQEYSTGYSQIIWSAVDDSGKLLSSGIYFIKLIAGDQITTQKLILMK